MHNISKLYLYLRCRQCILFCVPVADKLCKFCRRFGTQINFKISWLVVRGGTILNLGDGGDLFEQLPLTFTFFFYSAKG